MTQQTTLAPPAAARTQPDDRLTLRLRRMGWESPGVLSLEFTAPDGAPLPPFGPGAHIDLHLPDGMIRQYSLCGDPADRTTYRVAVREIEDGRVSRAIHRELRPGTLLTIGVPRNNFPLIASPNYLFVAGGIGITPLLPMMREATSKGTNWTLLFCARRPEETPFLHEARALGGTIALHVSANGTRLDVAARLAKIPPDTILYCCGPESLMTAVEAATLHWPADTVRFEWFTARGRPEDEQSGTFQLICAQSNQTLTVPQDRSILETLAQAGITIASSCEQGICGTCECRIIEGEADHRDSILSATERAANQTMMICVSRSKTPRLVLDL